MDLHLFRVQCVARVIDIDDVVPDGNPADLEHSACSSGLSGGEFKEP